MAFRFLEVLTGGALHNLAPYPYDTYISTGLLIHGFHLGLLYSLLLYGKACGLGSLFFTESCEALGDSLVRFSIVERIEEKFIFLLHMISKVSSCKIFCDTYLVKETTLEFPGHY